MRAFIALLLCFIAAFVAQDPSVVAVPCMDDYGEAQPCQPEFVNAALNADVRATNTCGEKEEMKYCSIPTTFGEQKTCAYCNAAVGSLNHPAEYLTDEVGDRTSWQSETMLELNRQQINNVNLTIHLGKSFYVRLQLNL